MRRLLALAAAAASLVACAVLVLAPAVPAAAGGNSANAKRCQKGGYQDWVRADQTPFADEGECVSYAAQGGTLTEPAPPPPTTISSADASASEGDAVVFTVSLSGAAAQTVTVDWSTAADGNASAGPVGTTCATTGIDYESASGTLTFAPGETSKTVSITTCEDADLEGTESFTLDLSNPTNATFAGGFADPVGRILGDGDSGTRTIGGPGFAINDVSDQTGTDTLDGLVGPLTITDVDLSIDNLTHTFLFDVSIGITSPDNVFAWAWAGGPGFGVTDLDLAIDDDSGNVYQCDESSPAGVAWTPTNCFVGVGGSSFAGFTGTSATGVWTLLIRDEFPSDVGDIEGWSITVTMTD